jgi:hypothetical protein
MSMPGSKTDPLSTSTMPSTSTTPGAITTVTKLTETGSYVHDSTENPSNCVGAVGSRRGVGRVQAKSKLGLGDKCW